MSLEDYVVQHYSRLNDTDRQIWQYAATHTRQVSRLSIDDFAKQTNVSRTTISRFTKKIGLSGYAEFKVLLGQYEKSDKQADAQLYDFACQSLIQYIEEQRNKDYTTVCRLIDEAPRVFAYGSGDIQTAVAKQLKRMFLSHCQLIYDVGGRTFDEALYETITANDVVILISLSGNNEKVLAIARRLKLIGAKIISITEYRHNQLTALSDASLYISSTNINLLKRNTSYQLTMIYFVLVELLFIKFVTYRQQKQERLNQQTFE